MRTLAIVNPGSGGGRTARDWPGIRERLGAALGAFETRETRGVGHATDLTRLALAEGFDRIVAVGGDGTLNEVANGFFDADLTPLRPDAVLVPYQSGTGGDFQRSFDFADPAVWTARLKAGHRRVIDVGRLDYRTPSGAPGTRLFVNIASFGLSGAVVGELNRARLIKRLGGRAAFLWTSLKVMATYRAHKITITRDDGPPVTLAANVVAIANGRYFGHAMKVAPEADPADGLFDVIILPPTRAADLLASGSLYAGTHVHRPGVQCHRARSVTAETIDDGRPALIDCDGEGPGALPARFTILPSALTLGV